METEGNMSEQVNGPGRCDVTGITQRREYVPLLANAPRAGAERMAADYSSLADWSAVVVKDNDRGGLIVATYVKGERQPGA